MFQAIGKDSDGRKYYAVHYQPGCLDVLPWRHEKCDCVVWLGEPDISEDRMHELSFELARVKNDWIQVAGPHCEKLHDAIDEAAVVLGRQRAVGDGIPMTSWHDEAKFIDDLAEIVRLNFGAEEYVLVVAVGSDTEIEPIVQAIRRSLV